MSQKRIVTPANPGSVRDRHRVQYSYSELKFLDTGFRRYDDSHGYVALYEEVKNRRMMFDPNE